MGIDYLEDLDIENLKDSVENNSDEVKDSKYLVLISAMNEHDVNIELLGSKSERMDDFTFSELKKALRTLATESIELNDKEQIPVLIKKLEQNYRIINIKSHLTGDGM